MTKKTLNTDFALYIYRLFTVLNECGDYVNVYTTQNLIPNKSITFGGLFWVQN